MKRGDVVLIDFPYTDGSRGKIRPAVVVQNDRDNDHLLDTVVALVTGNTSRADRDTQQLIDPSTEQGSTSGLHAPSCVLCGHLFAVRQSRVTQQIGQVGEADMAAVGDCLQAALGLNG